jgi:hypothetical protein
MNLSIADRRALANKAARNAPFRKKLATDPRAAIEEATGRVLSGNIAVKIVDENGAWCFVVPMSSEIAATLPEPTDDRSAIENDIYTLIRDQPALRQDAMRDPKRFLREYFAVDLGQTTVELFQEEPDTAIIVVPNPAMQGELQDELLDLVAGGGPQTCNTNTVTKNVRD